MKPSPTNLSSRVAEGILAFPASAFLADGSVDREGAAAHAAMLAAHGPAALVPAGGAGEIFSLDLGEQQSIVRITVENAGDVPVIAGVGHGLAVAKAAARNAEASGAAGILLFPPYLTQSDQDGLANYVAEVCGAVGIGVIMYSRNNGILNADTTLRLAERLPNFIGVKDGVGDFETILRLKHRGGDRLVLINGVPTAEIIAAQCFAVGIRSYSSAVFTFLPAVATRFYEALRDGERTLSDRLMADFYLPLIDIRNRRPGYAVSIVKAGLAAVGRSAGAVRAPLHDLTADEMKRLEELIDRASVLVAAHPQRAKEPA